MSQEEKNKVPNQAVEFLPDALEIKNSRLPLAIRLCVWMPLVIIVAAIVWSYIAEVDVTVTARGKVITDSPTVVLKPFDRVVIKEILVKVGDVVEEGQVLFLFDPEMYRAEEERLKNDVATYQAQYDRLLAEFSKKEYAPGKDASEKEKNQLAIYKQRSEYYREKIKYFDEALKQYDASRKTKEDALASYRAQLEIFNQLYEKYKDLETKNAATWREVTDLTVRKLEMESAVVQVQNSIQELQHERSAMISNKESFIQEWRNSISEDMVAIGKQLFATQKEYDRIERLIKYTSIESPCKAVVHEIAAFSENSAVREAEALITLIPLDGDVLIEAEMRPMDIGKVKKDSDARIKLDAWPYQKYGTLEGTVVDISENTIEKGAQPMNPEAMPTYYRVRLQTNAPPAEQLKGVPDDFRLIPGMEAQVEIKAGRRRVLTYVTYPLIKALDSTAREP